MKKLLILASLFVGLNFAYAGKDSVVAKKLTCEQLQNTVQEKGSVLVKGFGSLTVYADADSCKFGYEARKSH